ncbi:MAG: hypothetical protein M0P26_02450 [Bacteroidales bacterium]|nr:hypothetical protein [Bacteroidales bacterium]
MGRKRKHQITRFKPNTPGSVSHERKTLVAEVFGEVNASGDIYIGKDLASYKTVTYVFKKEEIESENKVEQTDKRGNTRKKEKRTQSTARKES